MDEVDPPPGRRAEIGGAEQAVVRAVEELRHVTLLVPRLRRHERVAVLGLEGRLLLRALPEILPDHEHLVVAVGGDRVRLAVVVVEHLGRRLAAQVAPLLVVPVRLVLRDVVAQVAQQAGLGEVAGVRHPELDDVLRAVPRRSHAGVLGIRLSGVDRHELDLDPGELLPELRRRRRALGERRRVVADRARVEADDELGGLLGRRQRLRRGDRAARGRVVRVLVALRARPARRAAHRLADACAPSRLRNASGRRARDGEPQAGRCTCCDCLPARRPRPGGRPTRVLLTLIGLLLHHDLLSLDRPRAQRCTQSAKNSRLAIPDS